MSRKCPINVPHEKTGSGRLRIETGRFTTFRRYFLWNTQAMAREIWA